MNVDLSSIMSPTLIVAGLAILFGAGLGYASILFAIDEDPLIPQIRQLLPGANCGACGFPGCDGFAQAVASQKAAVDGCPVGGAKTAKALSKLMKISSKTAERKVAFVRCGGDRTHSKIAYDYHGIKDCNIASSLNLQGEKACQYSCFGLGSCVKACPFEAIKIVDQLAVIDPFLCTSCGICVAACPRHLIQLFLETNKVKVRCQSEDIGKQTRNVCTVGCIACGICVKNCKYDAIQITNNHAIIDDEKCVNCGVCVEKCPTKSIEKQKA